MSEVNGYTKLMQVELEKSRFQPLFDLIKSTHPGADLSTFEQKFDAVAATRDYENVNSFCEHLHSAFRFLSDPNGRINLLKSDEKHHENQMEIEFINPADKKIIADAFSDYRLLFEELVALELEEFDRKYLEFSSSPDGEGKKTYHECQEIVQRLHGDILSLGYLYMKDYAIKDEYGNDVTVVGCDIDRAEKWLRFGYGTMFEPNKRRCTSDLNTWHNMKNKFFEVATFRETQALSGALSPLEKRLKSIGVFPYMYLSSTRTEGEGYEQIKDALFDVTGDDRAARILAFYEEFNNIHKATSTEIRRIRDKREAQPLPDTYGPV